MADLEFPRQKTPTLRGKRAIHTSKKLHQNVCAGEVCEGGVCAGGVWPGRGCLLGVCMHRGWGSRPGGVSAQQGVFPGRGVCSGCVCWGVCWGLCLPLHGVFLLRWRCLPRCVYPDGVCPGGVCLRGDVCPGDCLSRECLTVGVCLGVSAQAVVCSEGVCSGGESAGRSVCLGGWDVYARV